MADPVTLTAVGLAIGAVGTGVQVSATRRAGRESEQQGRRQQREQERLNRQRAERERRERERAAGEVARRRRQAVQIASGGTGRQANILTGPLGIPANQAAAPKTLLGR